MLYPPTFNPNVAFSAGFSMTDNGAGQPMQMGYHHPGTSPHFHATGHARIIQALQPGLVEGRWTQEEDDIIIKCINSGNEKCSDIARRLPGRIGEQIKEHWMNVLDPDVKRGIGTEDKMKILRDSQKELGNKWSDIAKRIPGSLCCCWCCHPVGPHYHPSINQYQ